MNLNIGFARFLIGTRIVTPFASSREPDRGLSKLGTVMAMIETFSIGTLKTH
jgi:hypothetical protein